jgi:predicted DCC family thiol-disulfide oxidoreductase YuxK
MTFKIMKNQTYPLTPLDNGACPVCSLEMSKLRAFDHHRHLRFEDISAPDFEAAPWGATAAELDALMYAVDATGQSWRGVPALRPAYGAVGRGRLWVPTTWPLLAPLFDARYAWFARNRHGISSAACARDDTTRRPS